MPKGPQYTNLHTRPDEWKRPGETIDSIIGEHDDRTKKVENQEKKSASEFRTRKAMNVRTRLTILFVFGTLFLLIGIALMIIGNTAFYGLVMILLSCALFLWGFDVLIGFRYDERKRKEFDSEI